MFISKALSFLFDRGKQRKSIDESLKVSQLSFNYLFIIPQCSKEKLWELEMWYQVFFSYFKKVYESIK